MAQEKLFPAEYTSMQNYEAAARKLASIYNIFSDEPLPGDTLQNWILVMQAAREVDTIFDSLLERSDRDKFVTRVLETIERGGNWWDVPMSSLWGISSLTSLVYEKNSSSD